MQCYNKCVTCPHVCTHIYYTYTQDVNIKYFYGSKLLNLSIAKGYLLLILFCYSERPDAEVSALDVLLNNELWTDAISLTAESCKEVCNYIIL